MAKDVLGALSLVIFEAMLYRLPDVFCDLDTAVHSVSQDVITAST
jgi:hypothetical protein